jgi:hypothetical protein
MSTQTTPVRIEVVRPKSYLVTVLVGDDEDEPWEAGWIPRSQLRPDPGYNESPRPEPRQAPLTGAESLQATLDASYDKHEAMAGHHWDILPEEREEADALGILPVAGKVWW